MTVVKFGDPPPVPPLNLNLLATLPAQYYPAGGGRTYVGAKFVGISLPHNYGIATIFQRDDSNGLLSYGRWATDGVPGPLGGGVPRNINGTPAFPWVFNALDDGNPAPADQTANGNPVYWLDVVTGPGLVPSFDHFALLGFFDSPGAAMTGQFKVYEWWVDPPPPPPPPPPAQTCPVDALFPYIGTAVGEPKAGVRESPRRVTGRTTDPVVVANDPNIRAALQREITAN